MQGLEGQKIDRYRVGRLLGAGGMGAVYAAVQEPLGRPVALKVLRPELSMDASIVARFKREAELAASLHHPGIAQVTDFGVADGRAFLVMDLLDGESLATLLEREGRLSEARVQRLAIQILAALAVAHERGIVHRDLKPENVFVQRVSGMELVKLLDFGIARMADADHKMTSTGAVLGTPAYMSPEQARGKTVDARSDLFSLGAMLYEMLAGHRAFSGENYHELMFAVAEQTPTPLAELRPGIDRSLAAIVERAMNKTCEARFASAREMSDALAALGGLGDDAPTPAPRDVSGRAFAATAPSDPRGPSPRDPASRDPASRDPASRAPASRDPASRDPSSRDPAPPRRPIAAIGAAMVAVAIGALGIGWALRGTGPGPALSSGGASTTAAPAGSAVGAPPAAAPAGAGAPDPASPTGAPLAPEPRPASATAAPMLPLPEPAPGSSSDPTPVPAAPPADEPAPAEPSADPGRVAATAVRARCGPAHEDVRELPIVRGRARLVATSLTSLGGARGDAGAVRGAVNDHAAELGACYRGHGLLPGQSFTMHVEADGTVTRVETDRWCPVDAAAASCVERVLGGLTVPNRGTAGAFRIGLELAR